MAGPYIARLAINWDGTTERRTSIVWLLDSLSSWVYLELTSIAPNRSSLILRCVDRSFSPIERNCFGREMMEMLESAIFTRAPSATGLWLRQAIEEFALEQRFTDILRYFQ
jgi:hypothetical protein